jgi:hypothetical protein
MEDEWRMSDGKKYVNGTHFKNFNAGSNYFFSLFLGYFIT